MAEIRRKTAARSISELAFLTWLWATLPLLYFFFQPPPPRPLPTIGQILPLKLFNSTAISYVTTLSGGFTQAACFFRRIARRPRTSKVARATVWTLSGTLLMLATAGGLACLLGHVASADTLYGYAGGATLGAVVGALHHTRLFGPEPKTQ